MLIRWAPSADKHRISHEDAMFAILNAVGNAELAGRPGEQTIVYVGHPHAQTDRYIEVITALRPPDTLTIFHVMDLSDLYRHLIGE